MSSSTQGTTSRELRSLQAIQSVYHPSLLRIRQVWSIPGSIVIAMDLAEASMLDLLELYVDEFARMIEIERLCHYMYQVAIGLDFLNTRQHRIDGKLVGLQHGDVKPNNILLRGEEAQLADYGLATPTSGPTTPCPRHGTAEYCAPEVFHGNLTERSDQFSFAVTYHVLRTGCFPYPAPPMEREKLRNYTRPEPKLVALPVNERTIVARALNPIPQDRFASCVEMMNCLLTVNYLQAVRLDDEKQSYQVIPATTAKSKRFQL